MKRKPKGRWTPDKRAIVWLWGRDAREHDASPMCDEWRDRVRDWSILETFSLGINTYPNHVMLAFGLRAVLDVDVAYRVGRRLQPGALASYAFGKGWDGKLPKRARQLAGTGTVLLELP